MESNAPTAHIGFATKLENKVKENLTTPEELEEMREFFDRLGFDTSQEPWIKVESDGTQKRVYKNLYRDKSGDFSGFAYERPVIGYFKNKDEFFDLAVNKK